MSLGGNGSNLTLNLFLNVVIVFLKTRFLSYFWACQVFLPNLASSVTSGYILFFVDLLSLHIAVGRDSPRYIQDPGPTRGSDQVSEPEVMSSFTQCFDMDLLLILCFPQMSSRSPHWEPALGPWASNPEDVKLLWQLFLELGWSIVSGDIFCGYCICFPGNTETWDVVM
ncbi:hypothetical protein BKA64DRAFT_2897 [Cadophora sp. MPI-SDFR-AT-0126]|nr:hypothetical protein BKA64DRAFT_2897 [Leotiomycetes sp. MPI-SDFR-AT-0126]